MFKAEENNITEMTELIFLTLCDKEGVTKLDHLRKSLENDLHVLDTYDRSIGYISKLTCVKAFLESATHLTDDCVIVFSDAFDVVCMKYNKKQILSKFKSTGKELITGAEACFAHHSPDVKPYFDEKYKGQSIKYLNAGFIIAYKSAYLKMLNYILNNYYTGNKNDQPLISMFMKENESLKLISMDIDYTSTFVFTYISHYKYISFDAIHSYFIHMTFLANPRQEERWKLLLTRANVPHLESFTLYTSLFTLADKDPSSNRYIDMFYIWLTYIIRNAGLGPNDSVVFLIDQRTLDYIKRGGVLDTLIEYIPFRFIFITTPVPNNVSEGICYRYTHAPSHTHAGSYVLFLGVNLLIVKALAPILKAMMRSATEFFVLPEGNLSDRKYGELMPVKTIGPGLAASWFFYKTSAFDRVSTLFSSIVKGCLSRVDFPFYTIDQPFYNLEVYQVKSLSIGGLSSNMVATSQNYEREYTFFVNYCGDPGRPTLQYSKLFTMLCMSYLDN